MLSHAISHIGSLWLSGRASERGWSEVRFLTETQNFSLSYARDKTINVFRYFFHLTYDIHVVIESVSLMKNCHVFIQDYKRLHGLLIRTLVTPLFACYLKSIAKNRKIYLFVGGRGYRAGSRFHVEGEGTMSRVEGTFFSHFF